MPSERGAWDLAPCTIATFQKTFQYIWCYGFLCNLYAILVLEVPLSVPQCGFIKHNTPWDHHHNTIITLFVTFWIIGCRSQTQAQLITWESGKREPFTDGCVWERKRNLYALSAPFSKDDRCEDWLWRLFSRALLILHLFKGELTLLPVGSLCGFY